MVDSCIKSDFPGLAEFCSENPIAFYIFALLFELYSKGNVLSQMGLTWF
jgi:hypothetical protein